MPPLTQADVLWREFTALHGHEPDVALTEAEAALVRAQTVPEPTEGGGHREAQARAALREAIYNKSVGVLPTPQSALCLSGGGVRSAAFSLGVLQGLAGRRLLSQFDYLSTVSGGGYSGAWLAAWAHRWAERHRDAAEPFTALEAQVARRPAYAQHELGPIRWLRRNQRYLTPRSGLLSGDSWAGAALFLRDMLLNWLVFVPALLAVLLVPRLLEMQLVWWAAFARDAGSAAGWMATAVLHAVGWWPKPGDMPGWRGWIEVVPMVLAFTALVRRFRVRASGTAITEGGFGWWILLPLFVAGWLFVMSASVVLANGVRPDGIVLRLWAIGIPGLILLARIVAEAFGSRAAWNAPEHWRNLAWDAVCLAAAGATFGFVVWLILFLRSTALFGEGTVRDLEAFGLPGLLVAAFAAQVIYTGLACRAPFGRREQEWTGRAAGLFLLGGTVWAIGSSIVIYGDPLRDALLSMLALVGVSGTLTLAGAVSAVTKANAMLASARQRVSVAVIVQALSVLFVLGLTVLLTRIDQDGIKVAASLLRVDYWRADRLVRALELPRTAPGAPASMDMAAAVADRAAMGLLLLGGLALGLLLVSLAMSTIVDVNLFSLHAIYRNRLVRSFLGASNLPSVTGRAQHRDAFDGFDAGDDVDLHAMWRPERAGGRSRFGPFPVLNIALNLVSGPDPAWQDRKAAPFVATPFALGGDLVGYMPHDPRHLRRQLTLGTAMAISGAAASPNWGYHSSPLIGFLMTLFNLRLGWWVENPLRVGQMRLVLRSFRLFLQEALGQTRASDPYLYLSDGGHFDNLGLYEMLRRRCRLILAVDATQDANVTLEDLGRTLRQVSIDLGIQVRFETIPFQKRSDPATEGLYATIGTITYPEGGPEGVLIYLKPGFFADAPADVRAYAAANPKFPHDSTFNQWFTESQFESYRALGVHVIGRVCGPIRTVNGRIRLIDLPERVARYVAGRTR